MQKPSASLQLTAINRQSAPYLNNRFQAASRRADIEALFGTNNRPHSQVPDQETWLA
jgi:hypothetical protein